MPTTPQLKPGITQHVWCSAQITKKFEDVFVSFVCNQAQNNMNVSEYVVYLTTLGGSPFSAVNLYNFVKSIPQKTTVYNMGTVYSAGVPFFLSFQKRIGVPGCSFMIHQTTLARTALPENFNVFDLDTQRASLTAIDDKTQQIIVRETASRGSRSLTESAIREAALKTATYHTDEARELGLIDEIALPKLPETGVLYLTDQSLAALPG